MIRAHGLGAIAVLLMAGCAAHLTTPGAQPEGGPVVAAGANNEPAPTIPPGCTPPSPLPPNAEYVPGEVLFKFKQPASAAELEAAKAHFGFTAISELGNMGIYKASFTGSVRQKIVDMLCDGRFEYAEPNGIVRLDPRETSGGFGVQAR